MPTAISTHTFFRGITVQSDQAAATVASIKKQGLTGLEVRPPLQIPSIEGVRGQLEAHFANPTLNRNDVLLPGESFGTYACGTAEGAEHYALHHDGTTGKTPLVIAFSTTLSSVYVDSRDFLCTAFQLWDRDGVAGQKRQELLLGKLFGPAILRYFREAARTPDQLRRIALCNLATFDPEVVADHLRNRSVILGRYRTRFASAFVVRCPVPAAEIVDVYTPVRGALQERAVSLDEFLALGGGG